jgi:hypothetical protein
MTKQNPLSVVDIGGPIAEWTEDHERFSFWLAEKLRKWSWAFADKEERVQACRIGLFLASIAHDPTRGTKFTTTAYFHALSVCSEEARIVNKFKRLAPIGGEKNHAFKIRGWLVGVPKDEDGNEVELQGKEEHAAAESEDFIGVVRRKVVSKFGERDWAVYAARVLHERILGDVGKEHGITKERVRQIQAAVSAFLSGKAVVNDFVRGGAAKKNPLEAMPSRAEADPRIIASEKPEEAFIASINVYDKWSLHINGQFGRMHWRALHGWMAFRDESGARGPSKWKAKHIALVMRATDEDKENAMRIVRKWLMSDWVGSMVVDGEVVTEERLDQMLVEPVARKPRPRLRLVG